MKQRLAVIDLDGTLLGPDQRVSAENLRALGRLQEAGIESVFASGRHHRNIVRYEPSVGAMTWVISSSGAVVRHAVSGELLHELTLLEADALALYEAGRQARLSLIVYHRDGAFMEADSAAIRWYAERAGWDPQRADLARLAANGIQKVLLCGAPELLLEIAPGLQRAFAERFYSVRTEEDIVEFLSPRANKAVGTEALARKLSIEPSEVLAFGDGNNDVELLGWAGYSVAMAHGQPGALAAAKAVTPPGPPETAFARAVELALAHGEGSR